MSYERHWRSHMSIEIEERLRTEAGRFPIPSAESTTAARQRVVQSGLARYATDRASSRPWRSWAKPLAAAVLAIAVAFPTGYAVAAARARAPASSLGDVGPGFLPAEGWDTLNTGLTGSRQAPVALASTTAVAAEDLSQGAGNLPRATIASLPDDGLLLWAVLYPRGESPQVDENFPEQTLPLSLENAIPGSLEGDPRPEKASLRLLSAVDGWNIDVIVFSGADQLTDELERKAQTELSRLTIPQPAATD